MIRVLIADDHPVVRRGLCQIVAEQSDMSVAGEAADGGEVMHILYREVPDILLLDINMPGRSGLEVLREVRQHYPRLPVLVLSVHPEDQIAVRALRAGASGYLTKDSAPDQLVHAIRKVTSGGKFLTPAAAEALVGSLQQDAEKLPHEALSDREYSVFLLLASGKRVSQIGAGLSLSVKTVSTYRTRILDKMNMKTNAELTRYALLNRLVE